MENIGNDIFFLKRWKKASQLCSDHYDFLVDGESTESLIALMNVVSNDLMCSRELHVINIQMPKLQV